MIIIFRKVIDGALLLKALLFMLGVVLVYIGAQALNSEIFFNRLIADSFCGNLPSKNFFTFVHCQGCYQIVAGLVLMRVNFPITNFYGVRRSS